MLDNHEDNHEYKRRLATFAIDEDDIKIGDKKSADNNVVRVSDKRQVNDSCAPCPLS